jgi:hypothetical protein
MARRKHEAASFRKVGVVVVHLAKQHAAAEAGRDGLVMVIPHQVPVSIPNAKIVIWKHKGWRESKAVGKGKTGAHLQSNGHGLASREMLGENEQISAYSRGFNQSIGRLDELKEGFTLRCQGHDLCSSRNEVDHDKYSGNPMSVLFELMEG